MSERRVVCLLLLQGTLRCTLTYSFSSFFIFFNVGLSHFHLQSINSQCSPLRGSTLQCSEILLLHFAHVSKTTGARTLCLALLIFGLFLCLFINIYVFTCINIDLCEKVRWSVESTNGTNKSSTAVNHTQQQQQQQLRLRENGCQNCNT